MFVVKMNNSTRTYEPVVLPLPINTVGRWEPLMLCQGQLPYTGAPRHIARVYITKYAKKFKLSIYPGNGAVSRSDRNLFARLIKTAHLSFDLKEHQAVTEQMIRDLVQAQLAATEVEMTRIAGVLNGVRQRYEG